MAYLDYPGLAYFKSLLDQTYLRVDYDGDTTIAGHVTFTNPITGDIDGRAKKDWLGQQFDTTYLKDIQPDESGALKLILGNGQVSHLVTDTTVTQERSSANETYPILLCYDENATADQIAKKVKYGHDVQINPAYGYIYAQGYVEKHPAYNRTTAQSSRVEWMFDFRDSVLNPVGQIYSYIDPSGQGGEHRMEFRLYGNPHTTSLNLPNYNFETDTVSLGVSSTKGDKLTFFGYAPSTPIYLENGSTMRKSTVRGDQYGRDIITRDWLNLNGSITGLVHTYMDETIDGYKTFLKTVTIDSGNDNAKAGLNVQGDVNIDSGDASKPSNLYVQGNSHIHGNEDIDGNLNVDGTSDQHGNVHMYHNLDVDGNANTDGNQTIGGILTVTGKITGNGGAEISGGSGLKVNGTTTTTNLSVTDDATIGDDLTVNGDTSVAGSLNKIVNNAVTEYVQYITNQPSNRQQIAANLIDTSKGLKLYSGKIGVNAGQSLSFDSNGVIDVDFDQMPTDKFEKLLQQLHLPLYVGEKNGSSTIGTEFYVAPNGVNNTADGRGRSADKPWQTIAYATQTIAKNYNISTKTVHINVAAGEYDEHVDLPMLQRTTGKVVIRPASSNASVTISRNAASGGCIAHTGGAWELHKITLKMTIQTASSNSFPYLVESTDSTGYVELHGCPMQVIDSTSGTTQTDARLIWVAGGKININTHNDFTGTDSQITWSRTGTNINSLHWLYIENSGVVQFLRSTASGNKVINVTGTFNTFAKVLYMGLLRYLGTGTGVSFTGNATGTEFAVSTGGAITTDAENNAHWFPGDTNGWVSSGTGSWISPAANYE
jgi:hypothetical protein